MTEQTFHNLFIFQTSKFFLYWKHLCLLYNQSTITVNEIRYKSFQTPIRPVPNQIVYRKIIKQVFIKIEEIASDPILILLPAVLLLLREGT